MELLTSADPDWDERLAAAGVDVYHTAGYHRFHAGPEAGEALLAIAGTASRGFAWPHLLRRVSGIPGLGETRWADVDSVYGYPGPVVWGCDPKDPFVQEAWTGLQAEWRQMGVVAAFTRFHPLLGNAALGRALRTSSPNDAQRAARPANAVVDSGATVSIDCVAGDDEAVGAYARVLRQEIAAARRKGLRTEHDSAWAELTTFVRLYGQTMDRNRAADTYRMSVEDARRLQSEVAPYIHLLITHLEGVVVAAGLFTEYRGIVQAHLVGTDDRYRRLSPLKVLLDDARRWARLRGNRVLHLGGGRGGREDSLFEFKARFSPRRHAFHTGRWILIPDAYEDLLADRSRTLGDEQRSTLDPAWFPAYRAPLIATRPVESV